VRARVSAGRGSEGLTSRCFVQGESARVQGGEPTAGAKGAAHGLKCSSQEL
jgi:hypothetical protein